MTFFQPPGTTYPWGPYGGEFWGGYWAPQSKPNYSTVTGSVNMTAVIQNYNSVTLSWTALAATFSQYILVRNSIGPAQTPSEAVIANGGASFLTFTDSNLNGGTWYYTLFAQEPTATPQWISIGFVLVTMPTNYSGGQTFFQLIPEWYQSLDSNTLQAGINGAGSYGQLRRFMELLGFQHDIIRTEAETLLSLWDPNKVRSDLLPYIAQMLGFSFEGNVGYKQVRKIMANWFQILKVKGTAKGIKYFTESLTGYSTDVNLGVNLLQTTGDSHLAATAHHGSTVLAYTNWQLDTTQILGAGPASNCTTFQIISNISLPTGYPVNDPTVVIQGLQVGGNANSAGYGFLCGNPADPISTGVPVTGGSTYTFSSQITPANNPHLTGFSMVMTWYTITGAYISTVTAPMTLTNGQYNLNSVTGAAPSNAYYCIPGVKVVNLSTAFYITQFQLELNSSPSTWYPAREVVLSCYPNRVNYFYNPSFELASPLHLSVNAASNLAQTTADKLFSNHSCLLNLTGNALGVGTATTDALSLTGPMYIPAWVSGDTWAFSCWIKGAQASIGETVTLSCNVVSNAATPIVRTVTGPAQLLGSQSWQLVSLIVQLNATDIANVMSYLQFTVTWNLGVGVSESYYVDGVLIERNAAPGQNSYFDGSIDPTTSDYAWAGTPNNSQSMFFPNKYVRNGRLVALLPDFVPVNVLTTVNYVLPIA